MKFQFQLTPLEELHAWGDEGDQTLHWFGLSDGLYWIELPGVTIFKYRDDDPPYVDYYVTRFWEDVLEILSTVLAPVPPEFCARLYPAEAWEDWLARANEAAIDSEDEGAFHRFCTAIRWWADRQLNRHYLNNAPKIHMWRQGDAVHIRWLCVVVPDKPMWEATAGECTVPVDEFLTAVRSFNEHFIEVMRKRCAEVRFRHRRLFPGVGFDFAWMGREHRVRRGELERRLAVPADTDWLVAAEVLRSLESALP